MGWLANKVLGIRQLLSSGTPLPLRKAVNFIGPGVSLADNPLQDRIDVTIPGASAVGVVDPNPDSIPKRDSTGGVFSTFWAPVRAAIATAGGLRFTSGAQVFLAARNALNDGNLPILRRTLGDEIALGADDASGPTRIQLQTRAGAVVDLDDAGAATVTGQLVEDPAALTGSGTGIQLDWSKRSRIDFVPGIGDFDFQAAPVGVTPGALVTLAVKCTDESAIFGGFHADYGLGTESPLLTATLDMITVWEFRGMPGGKLRCVGRSKDATEVAAGLPIITTRPVSGTLVPFMFAVKPSDDEVQMVIGQNAYGGPDSITSMVASGGAEVQQDDTGWRVQAPHAVGDVLVCKEGRVDIPRSVRLVPTPATVVDNSGEAGPPPDTCDVNWGVASSQTVTLLDHATTISAVNVGVGEVCVLTVTRGAHDDDLVGFSADYVFGAGYAGAPDWGAGISTTWMFVGEAANKVRCVGRSSTRVLAQGVAEVSGSGALVLDFAAGSRQKITLSGDGGASADPINVVEGGVYTVTVDLNGHGWTSWSAKYQFVGWGSDPDNVGISVYEFRGMAGGALKCIGRSLGSYIALGSRMLPTSLVTIYGDNFTLNSNDNTCVISGDDAGSLDLGGSTYAAMAHTASSNSVKVDTDGVKVFGPAFFDDFVDIPEGLAAPASPPAGSIRLFWDTSGTPTLCAKTSGGTVYRFTH